MTRPSFLLCACLLGISVGDAAARQAGQDLDLLSQLRDLNASTPNGDAERIRDELVKTIGAGADEAILRAISFLDASTPFDVGRLYCFDAIVKATTSRDRAALAASAVLRAGERLRYDPAKASPYPGGLTDSIMIGRFLKLLATDPWRGWVGADGAVAEFAAECMVRFSEPNGMDAQIAWEGLPADAAVMSTAAAKALLVQPIGTEPPMALVSRLEPAEFPLLRADVTASPRDPVSFHWGPAAALAYAGDVASRDQLIQSAEALERGAFREQHGDVTTRWAQDLRRLVWLIDVQTPPAKLPVYIASTDRVSVESRDRPWALGRALKLGVPPQDLRAAILKFADEMRKADDAGTLIGPTLQRWTRGKPWPEVIHLKAEAIRLGIMTKADLPDIPVFGKLPR